MGFPRPRPHLFTRLTKVLVLHPQLCLSRSAPFFADFSEAGDLFATPNSNKIIGFYIVFNHEKF